MKILGSILALILLAVSVSEAQINVSDSTILKPKRFSENIFGIGVHASLTSGLGLSFRQRLAGTAIAYQITGGIIKAGSFFYYDLGAEFQLDLSGSDNDRVYVIGGAGYYFKGEARNELKTPTRIGVGIGYEFSLTKQIGASAGLLISGFLPNGDILPLPQLGFHYFFK